MKVRTPEEIICVDVSAVSRKKFMVETFVIDRIDNNGHYEVGNLRFVTHLVSTHNRRVSRICPVVS